MKVLTSHKLITVAGGYLNSKNSLRLLDEIKSFIGVTASEITEGFFCPFGDGWTVVARLSDGTFATYIGALEVDGWICPRLEIDAINFVCDQLESSENLMLSVVYENADTPQDTRKQLLRWQRARRLVIQGREPRLANIQAALEI